RVRDLLGQTRLLTLTGTGGVGKTRLALRVAGALAASYADGVWLVELAALAEPALVAAAIASALGLAEQAERSAIEAVIDYTHERILLLVLDNCEHLLQGCAEVCECVLRSCPGVRILATSRAPLRVPGEIAFRVPSLAEDA